MAVNKWGLKNPERYKEIQKNYYNRNKKEASLRSRRQHHIGRTAFKMLTEDQKAKCIAEVEKLLTSDI